MTTLTPALSAISKFTESDDCTWFEKAANENNLQPYDLGLVLSLFCDPSNDYCQSINEILDSRCVNELPRDFYNPLRLGLSTGEIYMRGFVADSQKHLSASTILSSVDPKFDNCSWLVEAADLLALKPFDLGLTITVFCEPANGYCQELTDLLRNVCIDQLPIDFQNPLAMGASIGQALITFIGEHMSDPVVQPLSAAQPLLSSFARLNSTNEDEPVNCSTFQELAKILELEPFDTGLVLSMICQDSDCKELQAAIEQCEVEIPSVFFDPLNLGFSLGAAYTNIMKSIIAEKVVPEKFAKIRRSVPIFDAKLHDCSWFPEIAKLFHLHPYALGASLSMFCDPTTSSCKEMDNLLRNVCVNQLAPKFYVPLRTGIVYATGICVQAETCQANIY